MESEGGEALSIDFKLWLEFEEVDPGNWDIYNDAANVGIELADGRCYGINVWTFRFLETMIGIDEKQVAIGAGLFIVPPDLFVKELTRECIEQTIRHLLFKGDLEDVLNPSVLAPRK
ncbi:hypothetical protein C8P68_10241 [Mucilaginibacter yixingensis]|uniref:Uncharacterized protein n=1 Tax=Mucilaginibacter yixingensis TaxID=1295612 RepID=A0A2T5JC36_9SPHI|nr:hypothetical protein [Mucilaginibacter yixingensis]PTQ99225.1 hypothetical protein C8P68_10241 [Mucilaginibacter yixingensis]